MTNLGPSPAHAVDWLRQYADNPKVASFQLMGEDFVRLTAADFAAIGEVYREQLANLPAQVAEDFHREQEEIAAKAHRWLVRYNQNLRTRVRGYLQLGSACEFAYPWPTVAILGICQVLGGLWKSRFYSLLGTMAMKLKYDKLEFMAEATEDVLRRTNRGIFADSVPMVLYALRCHELRLQGRKELAEALLSGPLPALMDEECRGVMRDLVHGLSIEDKDRRFRFLADLTLRQFDREQSVFTHHMGVDKRKSYQPVRGFIGRFMSIKAVPAPTLVGKGPRRHVEFRPYEFPDHFDMRNHRDRVTYFGDAFVSSVTRSVDDYVIATDYVRNRFGRSLTLAPCVYSR
jgi:hypothetical protein